MNQFNIINYQKLFYELKVLASTNNMTDYNSNFDILKEKYKEFKKESSFLNYFEVNFGNCVPHWNMEIRLFVHH